MKIATITGQGLRWIAALVMVLWGCIVTEHSVVKQARHETSSVLAELHRMRDGQRPIPVSSPMPRPTFGVKAVIG